MDYQKIKEAESQQTEHRFWCLPVHPPNAQTCPPSETQLVGRKPPVKPPRSIKGRPVAQHETERLTHQQKHNEVMVKRIASALVLGPVGTLEALTPSLHAHTQLWFERTQLPRLRTPGQPLPGWLHGFATRREAEQLLQDKPQGCFLLRLSKSKFGFVLSYRGEDRCRHFIIEEENSGTFGSVYLIAGENSRHQSLEDLINYYTHNPVGPFNEMLTVPCMQPIGEETESPGLKNQEGEEKENVNESIRDKQTKLPVSAGPAVLNPLPTNSSPTSLTRDESAQYAAVRKPLKKTFSLPESKCGPDTAPPGAENGMREFAERSFNLNVTGNETHPAEAPYARVNKPARANIAAAHSDLQGATAASTTPAMPSSDASAADERYWKLEPLHTYEETVHTRMRDEGWRRQRTGETVELPKHLYSEVNFKGVQEHPAVSGPTPNLLFRPPRTEHPPLRAESTGQTFSLSPPVVPPQHSAFHHSEQPHLEASSSSIYEQIPVRPPSSRPALPPPHLKR